MLMDINFNESSVYQLWKLNEELLTAEEQASPDGVIIQV
jgi:hypothetical protein